jgi:hypothetical protein
MYKFCAAWREVSLGCSLCARPNTDTVTSRVIVKYNKTTVIPIKKFNENSYLLYKQYLYGLY